MKLVVQLVRPFSIRGVRSGSVWHPRLAVVLAGYAAIFAYGYFLADPIAHVGLMLGLNIAANCALTLTVIVASLVLMMLVFDRFIAGRMILSPRLVKVLFYEARSE